MGGVVTVRGAATVACSVLAVGCVGAFLAPVLAPVAAGAAAAGAASALTEVAKSLGGNIAANWIDKHGPDKLRSLLSGSLSLPRHDDMVRVADLALSAAIGHFLTEIEQDATGDAGVDFTNSLKRLQEQAKSHSTRLPAAEADAAITQALTQLSGPGAVQALTMLLADTIAPDMRRGLEREYGAEWQALAHRLHTRLPDLLSAYLAEALKSDERFFRAVIMTLHAAQVQTGQDVLTALQALDQKLSDWRAKLAVWLTQQPIPSLDDIGAVVTQALEPDRIPAWEWHSPYSSNPDSLIYYHRHAAFVGRDAAMGALNRFLDAPDPVLWTIVNGPAGVGKSRLVLEALAPRRLMGQVDAWFLNMTKAQDWNYAAWQAPRPTVLVIDYASVDANWVCGLLTSLKSKADNGELRSPVRILLLDTLPYAGQFSLHSRITGGSEGGALAMEVEWKGDRTQLDLKPLESGSDLLGIVGHFRNAALTADERERVAAAVGADPELARPLFAALMGLALRHGSKSPLTLEGVTSHFLDRQEAHWAGRDQITPLDRTLLALATLGGSVPLAVLDEPALGADAAALENVSEHWAVMTGKAWNDDAAQPFTKLEPDFVGGLFIMRHIQRNPKGQRRTPQQQQQERDRLITLAWKHGDPREPLINLARNFAGVGEWVGLVTELALYRPDGANGERWAMMVPNLAFTMAQRGADDPVDRLLAVLETSDSTLDKEMLALAYFASGLASQLGRHPKADDRLDQLRKLMKEYPDNIQIMRYLCQGLINKISDAETNIAYIETLLGELGGLHKNPVLEYNDIEFTIYFCMGIVNCLIHAGKLKVFAKSYLYKLRDLSDLYSKNPEVAYQYASGLSNVINYAMEDLDWLHYLLKQLRILTQKFRGNPEIALKRCTGLFNAIYDAGKNHERQNRLLMQISILSRQHKGNPEIALQLAIGLVKAVEHSESNFARVDCLLDRLHILFLEYNGNTDIVLYLAMGLFNAICHTGGDAERTDRLLNKLRDLHGDNGDIALYLAKGLFSALYHGHGDDDALVGELSVLAAAYPGVEMIQQAFALAPEAIAERDANRGD